MRHGKNTIDVGRKNRWMFAERGDRCRVNDIFDCFETRVVNPLINRCQIATNNLLKFQPI